MRRPTMRRPTMRAVAVLAVAAVLAVPTVAGAMGHPKLTGTVGKNDAFKISQLSSNTVKVPVPGSLLLLGLGLTLLTFVRSRPVARVSPRVA